MKRLIALLLLCVLLYSPLSVVADVTASTPLADRSSAMLNNIDLAIRRVNGTYVAYGDELSFNDEVGPRGTAQGYEKAENGRGMLVIAGGVSHVATTIYMAVKKLGGIEFTEKQVYGRDFVQSYVSSGDDAIVTAWSNQMDFRFINYNAGFTISMWRDGERMYCQLDTSDAPSSRPDPYLPVRGTYYVANCENYISLRAYPDTSASHITRIPYRAAVTCLGWAENGFYQVEYDGLTGYALSGYLCRRGGRRSACTARERSCTSTIASATFPFAHTTAPARRV
ncbi:MAG: VanW family protein [Clostridia bacterium]